MSTTILTQFSQAGDITSTLAVRGRGYIHMLVRVGSAVSAPTISNMSVTLALQGMIPGSDELWCDITTWSVVATDSMTSINEAINSIRAQDMRVTAKSMDAGICQISLWEG